MSGGAEQKPVAPIGRRRLAINGLPVGAILSSGRPYRETGWNLKPDEIRDLHLVLPDTARGEIKFQLVVGEIIADPILRGAKSKSSARLSAAIRLSAPMASCSSDPHWLRFNPHRGSCRSVGGWARGMAGFNGGKAYLHRRIRPKRQYLA